MAEYPERVGGDAPGGVDVVDVGLDAVGGKGIDVAAGEVRTRALYRRGAGVVLCCDHEHAVSRLGDRLIGERVTVLAATFEPDLHRVAGIGPGDDSTHLVVVDGSRV